MSAATNWITYLSLGTNVGAREENLTRAISILDSSGASVIRHSSIYETAPQDVLDQPWFLNMVLECRTALSPLQLISTVLRIEKTMGRKRGPSTVRRGPRLIDIDVLLYRDLVFSSPRLTVPHPRMLERRFVLEPLLELVADMQDPRTKKPMSESLAELQNQSVTKLP